MTDADIVIPPGMEDLVTDWCMAPGRWVGDTLYLTGFNGCPVDAPPPADLEAQLVIAFDTVGDVLGAAGLHWRDVVDMTSFHIGLVENLDLIKSVRARYVAPPYPAWTALEVAGFATPGVLIEIKAVAQRPGRV